MGHFLSDKPARMPDGTHTPFPNPNCTCTNEVELNEVLRMPVSAYKKRFASRIKFHTVGDTGYEPSEYRDAVVDLMEARRLKDREIAFFYHLGDVVYETTDPQDSPERYASRYEEQFYKSFDRYHAPKLAIPGCHDTQVDSLWAFHRNFCDPKNIKRGVGYQPNHYWKLAAPFVNIIGLSTNQADKGHIDNDQMSWFADTLKKCSKEPKALVVAMYYPPLDNEPADWGGSSGSPWLYNLTSRIYREADFYPHLVLSGHWHAYQRLIHTRVGGKQSIHAIAGCGGKNSLYGIYSDIGDMDTLDDGANVVLNSKLTVQNRFGEANPPTPHGKSDYYGFLEISVDKQDISGQLITIDGRKDEFSIDIKTRTVTL